MNDLFAVFMVIATIIFLTAVLLIGQFYETNKYIEKGYVWQPRQEGRWILPTHLPEKVDK